MRSILAADLCGATHASPTTAPSATCASRQEAGPRRAGERPSDEMLRAEDAWKWTVHSTRFEARARSGRVRCAPAGRSLYDQQPHRVAGTHPLPLHIPLTSSAWEATVAVWSTVDPDVDAANLLDLDEATVRRLLAAYGLPSDLVALGASVVDHISARSWLYAAVGDAAAIAALSAATHAFIQLHAPALWLRLAPQRDCLELLHGLFWREMEEMDAGPLPPENARFQRLLRLLPAQVRTLVDAHVWLGEQCMLALWFSLRIDHVLLYAADDEREALLAGVELLKIAHERFTAEPETCREAWFLQRWVVRARLGELPAAEQAFRTWIEAHPRSCAGYIAWADALVGNVYHGPVNVRAYERAKRLIALLEYRTEDDDEKRSIKILRAQIDAALDAHRRSLRAR